MNMVKILRSFYLTLIIILCLVIGFTSGYFLNERLSGGSFPILEQAHAILRDHGLVDPPETPALEYGMIRGMVSAYGDPFTSFLEPVQTELTADNLRGRFGGIGVELSRDGEGFVVLLPFPEGPADRAGILEADRLLAVDDLSVTPETTMEAVQAALRGPEGEVIYVRTSRPPDLTIMEFEIRRESIPIPSTISHIDVTDARIGVIKVNIIAASTPDELVAAARGLQDRGATHFILDLRDNGGGLLESGVDTARLFLREGIIMQQRYRGQAVETYRVETPGVLSDLPLVVLINQGTASAAEIIAGALKAHQRALLAGEPTYGKDTMQLIFDLKDGSSLQVTAGNWWVPGLDQPPGEAGILPDTPISADPNDPDAVIRFSIPLLVEQGR
jgi:carboxyl-terminal processing protease